MRNYHSFEFLNKIYFERTGGSKKELKAANLIQEEIEFLGGKSKLEEFEVDESTIERANLFFPDLGITVECAGSGYSGDTPEGGVTGELVYVTCDVHNEMVNYKNKVILWVGKRCPHYIYEKAVKEGAVGIILTTGDVFKNVENVDLDPYLTRIIDYKLGKIPTVMIRIADAEAIIESCPKKATIILKGTERKAKSHNIIAEIQGINKSDKFIAFTAHFDSVRFSKGAYDNGTGVVTLLQLYNYYLTNKPKRNLKFIWCGSEEMGLLGSKNYTSVHEEDVKKNCLLCVNVDMVACTLGYDYCAVTGAESIVNIIKAYRDEVGFPIKVHQEVYSSDSTPFADKGVPAITFARLSPSGGAVIHSHDDVIERLSETNYLETCKFIEKLTSKWINAVKFPLEKEMPTNMTNSINEYFFRTPYKSIY